MGPVQASTVGPVQASTPTAEGTSKTEIIRCLKRYIAVAAGLLGDTTERLGLQTITINCGAGPIGRTISAA